VNLLLDTCTFLTFVGASRHLSPQRRKVITDEKNRVFLSSVSAAEIAIKHSIGKLELPEPPGTFVPRARILHQIDELPLDELAALRLSDLPLIHRDPFDRLLICQALAHNLTLVTSDSKIQQYELSFL